MLTDAKCRHIKNNIFQNKGNAKELFKITSGLLNPYVSNVVNDSEKMCEKFNNFFVDKITKIREQLDDQNPMTSSENSNPMINSTLSEFEPTSPETGETGHLKLVLLTLYQHGC